MKKLLYIAFGLFTLCACSGKDPVYWFDPESKEDGAGSNIPYYPSKPSSGDTPVDPQDGFAPAGYSLKWSDEFDNQADFYTNWHFEKGGTGWGNGELQYYCQDGVYTPTGQKTAAISDGTLKIKAYKIKASASSDNKEFISTRMNTNSGWQYGYMEMRAKMPMVAGCWPAFWMLPINGPYWVRDASGKGAEIDIMEFVPGDDPKTVWFSAHSYNATGEAGEKTGYVDPVSGIKYRYTGDVHVDDPQNWHCYGLEWTHEYIKGFLDGVEYYYAPNPIPDTVDSYTWPFDQIMNLKLNLAIGGAWGGTPAANFTEATYEVDWVRVYQK